MIADPRSNTGQAGIGGSDVATYAQSAFVLRPVAVADVQAPPRPQRAVADAERLPRFEQCQREGICYLCQERQATVNDGENAPMCEGCMERWWVEVDG